LAGPDIAPLFCPIYNGTPPIDRALSRDTVKRLVKEGADRAGLDAREARDFSGPSMRVGAAQDLLRRGFDTAAIMRGRLDLDQRALPLPCLCGARRLGVSRS
jgi:hypothetical protein